MHSFLTTIRGHIYVVKQSGFHNGHLIAAYKRGLAKEVK